MRQWASKGPGKDLRSIVPKDFSDSDQVIQSAITLLKNDIKNFAENHYISVEKPEKHFKSAHLNEGDKKRLRKNSKINNKKDDGKKRKV